MSDERRLLTYDRKVLLDAADYIERYGHAKGWYFDGMQENPPACILGALMAASGYEPVPFGAVTLLQKHVYETHLAYWNDKPARTKQEVIEALRGAALSSHKCEESR